MKYLSFLLIILFYSCGSTEIQGKPYEDLGKYGVQINVVVIDSCEYIVAEEWQKGISVIHKQNCRFCIQRKELAK